MNERNHHIFACDGCGGETDCIDCGACDHCHIGCNCDDESEGE